jgi:hypothetical protein
LPENLLPEGLPENLLPENLPPDALPPENLPWGDGLGRPFGLGLPEPASSFAMMIAVTDSFTSLVRTLRIVGIASV